MRKRNSLSARVSIRVALLLGVILVGAALATAYLARQRAQRPYDPKAVVQAPSGISPGPIPFNAPTEGAEPQVELVKHPKLSTPLAELARAVPQLRGALAEGQQLTPPLGFSLEALPKSTQDAVRAGQMQINPQAEVQTYVVLAELTEENLRQLRAAGVSIELTEESQRIAQARIPVTRLEAVAALPFVQTVRLPDYGIPNIGAVTSEGDTILAADQARILLGVDGSGVSVGVISDGIAGIFDTGCLVCAGVLGGPIATADLPGTDVDGNPTEGLRDPIVGTLVSTTGGLIAQSFRADLNLEGGLAGAAVGAEGTAMLEIIHDLAPGAQLYFANFQTSIEFNQAVNFLALNADIVVDDLSFFGKPYDGTSDVSVNTAAALNNDANPVRAHFTSVGNHARRHYQEPFVDSLTDGALIGTTPPLPTGNLHLFDSPGANATGDCLALGPRLVDQIFLFNVASAEGAGASVTIFLVWDDTFDAPANDYDLYLVEDATGVVVASSTDVQNAGPGQNPVEIISFTNTAFADGFFDIIIQNWNNGAGPFTFDMFVRGATAIGFNCTNNENHNYNTIFSSVSAQSDAGGTPNTVVSLGAIDQADPLNDDIEIFSSQGPTNDGRIKPDLTAIDGVLITGAAGFGVPAPPNARFFGTSAAAPHAAGIAALVMQSAPCLAMGAGNTPGNARAILLSYLTASADDLGTAGSDNVFGAGRMNALTAANLTLPTPNAGSAQSVSGTGPGGASVTLDATASADPSNCTLTYSWTGDCGAASGDSPSVTCPLGVNTVDLAISNGGAILSPFDSVVVTVTDFSASASPATATVTAGQTATYTITLTPGDGPYDNPIALSCSGLPSLSSCSFSPPSVTPGASAATSTMSITTTAPSTALPVIPTAWPTPPIYVLGLSLAFLALLGCFLVGVVTERYRLTFWLPAGTVFCLLMLLVACGGSKAPKIPGTPTGTSTITVTGTAGTLTHSTTTSLVVQ